MKIWIDKLKSLWMKLRGAMSRCVSRIKMIHLSRAQLGRLGYYAALACLLIILGSASYAYRNNRREPEQTEVPRAAIAVQPVETPRPEAPRANWVWPLEGEIVGAFSPRTPVWSSTLAQWQTHAALDIAGSPGEAVYACADGVVADAWQDALWGNVIVLSHTDGYESTYAGLNTLNMVSAGDAVSAGDVIGAVGQSADCEAELSWHLHFELTRDGVPIDFEALAAEADI